SSAMPRTRARVVCTLRETMDTLVPTRALTSVDLPAFGAPMRATKPQRVASPAAGAFSAAFPPALSSDILVHRPDPLAQQEGLGRRLLGIALGRAAPLSLRHALDIDADDELGRMVRPGALDELIGGRRQAAPLRPLLQRRLGVAQGAARGVQARREGPLDQRARRGIAPVEEDRADD